jgi:hypothetical protein
VEPHEAALERPPLEAVVDDGERRLLGERLTGIGGDAEAVAVRGVRQLAAFAGDGRGPAVPVPVVLGLVEDRLVLRGQAREELDTLDRLVGREADAEEDGSRERAARLERDEIDVSGGARGGGRQADCCRHGEQREQERARRSRVRRPHSSAHAMPAMR